MQSTLRTIALATLVAIASLAQTLHAQSMEASRIDVPFAFDYGTQHFPAGVYTVKMLSPSQLALVSGTGTTFAMIQADCALSVAPAGYVMFRKYGDRYFLDEYRPANSGVTATVYESKTERIVARHYEASKADSGLVRLALLDHAPAGKPGMR
jgi:hypothetical protein